ncbi:MAG: hypothetical protein KDK11_10290 [Maritimibacter sp.]|nr:hypothetical protein [Maritimibacter sp.]
MARFRKIPVVIEAALFDGELVGDVVYEQGGAARVAAGSWPRWFPADLRDVSDIARARDELREGEVVKHGGSLFIGTLEGVHEARPGDWIIRGIKGELYPCKPDIFAKTYERAN